MSGVLASSAWTGLTVSTSARTEMASRIMRLQAAAICALRTRQSCARLCRDRQVVFMSGCGEAVEAPIWGEGVARGVTEHGHMASPAPSSVNAAKADPSQPPRKRLSLSFSRRLSLRSLLVGGCSPRAEWGLRLL